MIRKETSVAVDSRRLQVSAWSDAFGDRRYRHSRSTTVIPHLGSKSTLIWRRDEPSQSQLSRKTLPEDEVLKPKTSQSLPSAASSLYTWKRKNADSNQHPKPATDRSYRHTYGDRQSSPFEIEIKKDFPSIRQKPDVPNPLALPADFPPEKPSLPNVLVTKIYNKLHDEESPQDKNCVYVIKNMRRTTPASKGVNLPTVIPLYNLHLVKSVSEVLSQELFPSPQEEENLHRLKRPMASERKYYSQISGNLLRSRKKLSSHNNDNRIEYGGESSADSRAFRSAEAYNKLLALKHANKVHSAAEEQSESCPPTSSKLRHSTHKVTFKCDMKEDIESPTDAKEANLSISPAVVSTRHVTSVKVSRRGITEPLVKMVE